MNRDPAISFQEGDFQTLTMFLRFLGCSFFFLRIFHVEVIFFSLSKILNAKMHDRMLWRRLLIVLSFLLNFSFCQNEKTFSFDQNENNATFTENLKLFQWFKMFHSFIDIGLTSSFLLIVRIYQVVNPTNSACLSHAIVYRLLATSASPTHFFNKIFIKG
jgi:hypothetical protein